MSQEALERLQSIITSLQSEKNDLSRRLARANQDRIDKAECSVFDNDDNDDFKDNYIYMKETGLVWSSTVLASRLRQPPSNRPVPFSKVYVCDFELDFVQKDDIEGIIEPMRKLKQRNYNLQNELNELEREN